METTLALLFLGAIVFIAHLLSWIDDKFGIPDLLVLVVIGLIIGPLTGIVPVKFFGSVGSVFAIVTLVFILLGAGLDLSFSALNQSLVPSTRITLMNYIATIAVVVPVCIFVFKLTVLDSFILGSIVGQTSSPTVISLARHLRMRDDAKSTLILESVLSDVLAIIIPLALIEAVTHNNLSPIKLIGDMVASLVVGVAFGVIGAFIWANVLHWTRRLENSMFLTTAFVFIVYAITELLGFSGPIAALAFGIMMGNINELLKLKAIPGLRNLPLLKPINSTSELNVAEKRFNGEIVFLLKTYFFIFIGVSMRFNNMLLVITSVALTALLLLVRIPVARFSLNKKFLRDDASLIAVITPKGVAAAAVAVLVVQAGLPNSSTIENATYMLILFTTLGTSILVFLVRKTPLRRLYRAFFSNYADTTLAPSNADSREQ